MPWYVVVRIESCEVDQAFPARPFRGSKPTLSASRRQVLPQGPKAWDLTAIVRTMKYNGYPKRAHLSRRITGFGGALACQSSSFSWREPLQPVANRDSAGLITECLGTCRMTRCQRAAARAGPAREGHIPGCR